MRSVNKVVIVGNVTRDPQTKTSGNGQAITTFGVATNRNWTTGDGQQRTSTEFHEVVAWARLAEICQQIIRKGVPVYLEGYLKTRTWETETGIKMRKTEIVIQDLILLERGGERSSKGDDMATPAAEPTIQNETTNDDMIIDPEPETAPAATPAPEQAPEVHSEPNQVSIEDDLGL